MLYGRNGTDHTRMHARQKREAKRALHDGIHEHAFPSPRSTRVTTSLASAQAPSRRRGQGQALRPFMADRVASLKLQTLVQWMRFLWARLTSRLPSWISRPPDLPPGLGPSGATSALNPGAKEFHPVCAQEYTPTSHFCEWWMHAPPGDDRYWECWGPQQLLDSRPRAEYRPPRTQGICGWCEKKPAVSRRRCKDCREGDDETKRATDCRTDHERATAARENLRKKELPGAKLWNLRYQQKKLEQKFASLARYVGTCHPGALRAGVQQAGG